MTNKMRKTIPKITKNAERKNSFQSDSGEHCLESGITSNICIAYDYSNLSKHHPALGARRKQKYYSSLLAISHWQIAMVSLAIEKQVIYFEHGSRC